MNPNLAWRRLCWKEFRQLLPLVLMLSFVGLFLQMVVVGMPIADREIFQTMLFLGLPGLFAAGVGALLVSQEKDTRTLQWLTSLPVKKRTLIESKLCIGFLGLITIWIISFCLWIMARAIAEGAISEIFPPGDTSFWYWPVHSLFLFTLSFATAWYFRSTFLGLLAIVVFAAAVPFIATWENALFSNQDFFDAMYYTVPSEELLGVNLIVLSAIALGIGWRAADRTLSPIAVPKTDKGPTMVENARFDFRQLELRSIQSPTSALIWQFTAQNRTALVGVLGLLGLALISGTYSARWAAFYMGHRTWIEDIPMLSYGLGYFAICWLGVVTFQGDVLHQRIRFLADRGISTGKVWFTRQVVPLSILILLAFSGTTILVLVFKGNSNLGTYVWVASGLALCVLSLFGTSQWFSQVIRSPIVAAIVAPLACLLSFFYGSIAVELMHAPLWSLIVAGSIPFVATYRMTRGWMDNRNDVRHWLSHFGWLVLALSIPVGPFLYFYITSPSVPRSEYLAMLSDSQRFQQRLQTPVELPWLDIRAAIKAVEDRRPSSAPAEMAMAGSASMGGVAGETHAGKIDAGGEESQVSGGGEPEGDESLFVGRIPWNLAQRSLAKQQEWQLKDIETQVDSMIVPGVAPELLRSCSVSTGMMRYLVTQATLARASAEDEGIQSPAGDRFLRMLRLVIRLLPAYRHTPPFLTLQTDADRIEQWLLYQLKLPQTREWLGDEMYERAVKQLANHRFRQESRYRSLLLSWNISKNPTQTQNMLGGFTIPNAGKGNRLVTERHQAIVVWRLKKYLEAGDASARLEAKQHVAKLWDVSPADFPHQGTSLPLLSSGMGSFPGIYWHGDWETEAEQLAVQFQRSKDSNQGIKP